jgi:predicted nucleotidyltransferase
MEQLSDKVEGLQTGPEIAILFGSAMRGEDHEDSDLDLYLLFSDSVPLDKGQLLENTADMSEDFYALTGNTLNVLVQKMSDLRTNFESRSRFLTNLLSDGRVLKGARVLTRLKEEYQWSNTQKGQSD